LSDDETFVLTLTTAPSATAQVAILDNGRIGAAGDAANDGWSNDFIAAQTTSLAEGGQNIADAAISMTATTAAGNAEVGLIADTAGTYAGTLAVWDAGASAVDTVSFSFTTRGAVASFTFSTDVSTGISGATITGTISVFDSAGNPTQPQTVDTFSMTDNGDGAWASSSMAATGAGGTAASLYDGVGVLAFTNSTTGTTTLTATAAGTISSLGAKTVSVSTITASATEPTGISVATPATGSWLAGGTNCTYLFFNTRYYFLYRHSFGS